MIKEKQGFYINRINSVPGEFHIPPNQMGDILPQHIILLKAAKEALKDAGISSRPLEKEPQRDDMGCAIGIEFDYGATNFYLRWKMDHPDEKSDEKSKDDIAELAEWFNKFIERMQRVLQDFSTNITTLTDASTTMARLLDIPITQQTNDRRRSSIQRVMETIQTSIISVAVGVKLTQSMTKARLWDVLRTHQVYRGQLFLMKRVMGIIST